MQEYKRIEISKDQVVPIAEKMRKAGVFLVMIHAFLNEEGQLVIYDDGGTMYLEKRTQE